jgi:acetyl-CoA C-acetyltransferase
LKKVAIIGTAQTTCTNVKNEIFYDLTSEAASLALADAGLERRDLDNIVLGEYDLAIGRTASHMYTVPAAGGFYRDEMRINDDGLFAAIQAYLGILSGEYDITLVLSTGISSEAPQETVSNLGLDPFFHRPLGLTESMANALQVLCYRQRYGITALQGAGVVVKNRRSALENPRAHLRTALTTDDVFHSPYTVYPLKEAECAPRSDGACAVVMAAEPVARRLCRYPVWITGAGWCNDTYYLGDKDLARLTALEKAAAQAYRQAGITAAFDGIDVAEVYDVTAYHELMIYEALGFCGPGEGGKLLDTGATQRHGRLPVNPSGGVLAARPLSATGLVRLSEAVLQLTDRASGRQVGEAGTALVQSMTGWGNQRAAVMILQR